MSSFRRSLLFCEVAPQRELEHLALQRFYNEHDPDHEKCESNHHGDQPDQRVANQGDEKQHESQNPERRPKYHADQKQSQTLKGMEAHEAILVIGLDKKEHN